MQQALHLPQTGCGVAARIQVLHGTLGLLEKLGRFLVWTFSQRRKPLKYLTWVCVSSARVARVVVATMHGVVAVAERLRLGAASRAALSMIYSELYSRGMSDELGGPEHFKAMMRTGDMDPSWTPVDAPAAPSR